MKVNILGTEYEIVESNPNDDVVLMNGDGYCDPTIKRCVINTIKRTDDSVKDIIGYKKLVTRHEIIHAFLYESGLDANSWGANEEVVDWIALQFPKLLEVFKEANVI